MIQARNAIKTDLIGFLFNFDIPERKNYLQPQICIKLKEKELVEKKDKVLIIYPLKTKNEFYLDSTEDDYDNMELQLKVELILRKIL
jgi:hypothetical protein